MSDFERWLPLFPLNTVLFPHASLWIQIFEARYKLMLKHCLDGDSKFGVILIKVGSEVGAHVEPYAIGTVAQITKVDCIEGGRRFILVNGQERFQIRSITQCRPYMGAQVELLTHDAGQTESTVDVNSVRQAVTEYVTLTLALRGAWVREVNIPSEMVALSYYIADVLPLGLPERQVILEELSVDRRLEVEWDILKRESQALKRHVAQGYVRRFSRQ